MQLFYELMNRTRPLVQCAGLKEKKKKDLCDTPATYRLPLYLPSHVAYVLIEKHVCEPFLLYGLSKVYNIAILCSPPVRAMQVCPLFVRRKPITPHRAVVIKLYQF